MSSWCHVFFSGLTRDGTCIISGVAHVWIVWQWVRCVVITTSKLLKGKNVYAFRVCYIKTVKTWYEVLNRSPAVAFLFVQMLMWVKTSGTSFYYCCYFCTTTMSPNLSWLPIATSFLLRRTCWRWTMQRSELPSSVWQWHKGRKSGGGLGGWQSSSSNTVGGNPAPVDRQLSHYLRVFLHPRWCRISSISSICRNPKVFFSSFVE